MPAAGLLRIAQSIFGSVSNWWNGGGELSVHSSVVAPSPQGLSGAFLPAASDQIRLMKKMPMPAAIILAAGQGTRMQSDLPKVMHPLAGRPMIRHLLAAAEAVFEDAGVEVTVVPSV